MCVIKSIVGRCDPARGFGFNLMFIFKFAVMFEKGE